MCPDALVVNPRKTDQDGAGRKIGIPYGSNLETCPGRTVEAWLEQRAATPGRCFGLDAAKYAGHSLRAEHATSAAIAGASERSIMSQTGYKSVQMVRRYIRDGSLFRENSAGKLGLEPWHVLALLLDVLIRKLVFEFTGQLVHVRCFTK